MTLAFPFFGVRPPFWTGSVSACSGVHPLAFMRRSMVPAGMPVIRPHSAIGRVRPSKVRSRLFRLFSACSDFGIHRQFDGSYGPSLLSRSMVNPGAGNRPMSARKLSKDCHRSQTVMPRPPYASKPFTLGLVQRVSMPLQHLYSGVPAMPCRFKRSAALALFTQAHPTPFLVRRLPVVQVTSAPHIHRQIHREPTPSSRRRTVSEPNVSPMMLSLRMLDCSGEKA